MGRRLRLQARDLLYIFFEVEKEFGIKIPEEAIVDGEFDSFNGIVKIIINQLEYHSRSNTNVLE